MPRISDDLWLCMEQGDYAPGEQWYTEPEHIYLMRFQQHRGRMVWRSIAWFRKEQAKLILSTLQKAAVEGMLNAPVR